MEGLGAILALKRLDEDDVGMALGLAFDDVLSLVAKPFVELRCLKTVADDNYLQAPATKCLRFGGLKDLSPQALTSMGLADPEVGDLTTPSPSVTTQPGDDCPCFVPDAHSQEPAIVVAGRSGVELIDAVDEECIQLLALSFVEECNVGFHGT